MHNHGVSVNDPKFKVVYEQYEFLFFFFCRPAQFGDKKSEEEKRREEKRREEKRRREEGEEHK
jgi:hypothetical protein